MNILKRLICKILKWIEEIIMKLTMQIDTEVHLPSFCDDVGYFVGADNVTIVQGDSFNPTEGVYATDGRCGRLPYDVSPSSIDTCEVGTHILKYSTVEFYKNRKVTVTQASAPIISGMSAITVEVGETVNTLNGVTAADAHGNTVAVTCLEGSTVTYNVRGTYTLHYTAEDSCGNIGTAERIVTILAGSFSGVADASVNQGIGFNLTDGVVATDYQGNTIPFTVTPSTFAPCQLGEQTFIYSAQGVESVTRTITVNAIADPTISGIDTTIEVGVGEEFDPLQGVTAVDGNGNAVSVTVALIPTA